MEAYRPEVLPRIELWERVLDVLRAAIIRGDLPTGRRLIEAELAEKLGVSSGTVRDALRELEYEGLVESRPRRGRVVVGVSERDIHELYELRTHLEILAAQRAVERANAADLGRLQELTDQMRDLLARGELRGIAAPDIAFHRELVRLADQRRLLAAWEAFAPTTRTLLSIADAVYTNMPWAIDQHQQIVDALRAREREHLERLVRTHTESGERVITGLIHAAPIVAEKE